MVRYERQRFSYTGCKEHSICPGEIECGQVRSCGCTSTVDVLLPDSTSFYLRSDAKVSASLER